MQENKSIVEEALIQMKNVEDVIAENAKGILHSTMKEEISQLVKESLSEQDELDVDDESDEIIDEPSDDKNPVDDLDDESIDSIPDEDDEDGEEIDVDFENFDSSSPIDMTHIDDPDVLMKVFKKMGENDGIIIKKDGDDVHLVDDSSDSEYIIKKVNESMDNDMNEFEDDFSHSEDGMSDQEMNQIMKDIFGEDYSEESSESNEEVYESDEEVHESDDDIVYEIEVDESDDNDDDDVVGESDDDDDVVGESDDDDDVVGESDDDDDVVGESDDENMNESYNHKKSKKSETKESKLMSKPKGVGIGKPKFSYKKSSSGFNEKKKEAPKSVGTGKASFKYKDGENLDGDMKSVKKKSETKEAARTYFGGSEDGSRGLRKGITPNRNFKYGKSKIQENLESEVSLLREKNEEYRKALNVFREKLNEVAIFNSNLAYATRLFTEHSTTKKEKINILRRFDNVESLKESKNLYKNIKDELNKTETKSINESVGNKIINNVSTGSSTTLIESKTYENPQFLRIKDLISKLN
jgi:hypothetical protein